MAGHRSSSCSTEAMKQRLLSTPTVDNGAKLSQTPVRNQDVTQSPVAVRDEGPQSREPCSHCDAETLKSAAPGRRGRITRTKSDFIRARLLCQEIAITAQWRAVQGSHAGTDLRMDLLHSFFYNRKNVYCSMSSQQHNPLSGIWLGSLFILDPLVLFFNTYFLLSSEGSVAYSKKTQSVPTTEREVYLAAKSLRNSIIFLVLLAMIGHLYSPGPRRLLACVDNCPTWTPETDSDGKLVVYFSTLLVLVETWVGV